MFVVMARSAHCGAPRLFLKGSRPAGRFALRLMPGNKQGGVSPPALELRATAFLCGRFSPCLFWQRPKKAAHCAGHIKKLWPIRSSASALKALKISPLNLPPPGNQKEKKSSTLPKALKRLWCRIVNSRFVNLLLHFPIIGACLVTIK